MVGPLKSVGVGVYLGMEKRWKEWKKEGRKQWRKETKKKKGIKEGIKKRIKREKRMNGSETEKGKEKKGMK